MHSRIRAVAPTILCLCACHPSAPLPDVYHVVGPGSGELTSSTLSAVSQTERTFSRAATGDTAERQSLVARVDEHVINDPSGPILVRVTTGHYAGGDYYDSLFVRRASLQPVREHLSYLQRKLDKRFDYRGKSVHQTNTTSDSSSTFERDYATPVFAFSEIETIIRSLPLRRGYVAILPLYSEGDDALEMDSVAVSQASPGDRWVVRFGDPAIIATYELQGSTRRIVSYEVISRKTGGRARKLYEP